MSEINIHCPLASGQTLNAHMGQSGLAMLAPLFTLHETARMDPATTVTGHRFQTDKAGLQTALQAGSCAQEALSDAVTTIGRLVSYTDHAEVDMTMVGFLLSGLGELKQKTDEALHVIALALAHGDHLPDDPRGGQDGQ